MKLIKKIKKGFTLVELVVVIAIIAILSGVSVAVYVGITDNAKKTAEQSEASTIGTVIRAAVLMDADGFEFGGYRATWSVGKGIALEKKSGTNFVSFVDSDATADVVEGILKDLYEKVESAKMPGAIIAVTDGDSSDNYAVKSFTYKNGHDGCTYNFVTSL